MSAKYPYPEWLTLGLVHGYKTGVPVKDMAEVLLYPETSVRVKLIREGVYQSKTAQRKQQNNVTYEEEGF